MQGKTPQVPHRDQTQQQEIGPDSIQHKDNIMATHNNRIISINQNKCLGDIKAQQFIHIIE